MSVLQFYNHLEPFALESGQKLENLRIGYHTYGSLNSDKSNVVWVCHALTASSDVPEWWEKLVGPEGLLNPNDHFIVCANIIGSCYGSSNPLDKDNNEQAYLLDFPDFTMRDIVKAHLLLKQHLEIGSIYLCMGGSCGGQQALEFAIMCPDPVQNLFVIAASARETAWSIAIHTAQRMAIEADGTWGEAHANSASQGLKAARGMGLLSYRSFQAYIDKQTDNDNKISDFKAESYIRYQGQKLADRFNAYSYWYLTKALDSHNIGRGRNGVENALKMIRSKTLVIGIDSDILIPFSEQQHIAEYIPQSQLYKLHSIYGHDAFLIEQEEISKELRNFLALGHGI